MKNWCLLGLLNSSVHGPNILSQAPGSLVSETFGPRTFIFKDQFSSDLHSLLNDL